MNKSPTVSRVFLFSNVAALCLLALRPLAVGADAASLNATFGASFWADDNLWDDVDSEAAQRLGWRPESRTQEDSSFREYAGPNARILGARPFSLALYGRNGRVEQISMVFANKGDIGGDFVAGDAYKKQIAADAKEISQVLSAELGPPKIAQFGQGVKTRERVERWDWNGHAILLAAPRGEYVAVRILPVAVADGEVAARVTDAALREKLKTRVEHRPNGDVILKEIPMVDQGPKGYCVPATWERALRYLGIPADMYVLAMAGQTEAGGGTNLSAMAAGAGELVRRNGRRLVTTSGRITVRPVAGFIDVGLPVMWGMYVVPGINRDLTTRSVERRQVTDWAAYTQALKPLRKIGDRIRSDTQGGHMCMIIGYNAATGEIAISDSWGPQFAERWITVEEANAISQREFTVVNW